MKRFVSVLLLLILVFSLYAFDYESSSRRTAMGGCSSSDVSDFINYFNNPAMVSSYSDSPYSLCVSTGIRDSYGSGSSSGKSPNTFLKLQFTGDNISLGLSTDYDMLDSDTAGSGVAGAAAGSGVGSGVAGSGVAKCIKQYQFSVNVSGSYSFFSGGIGARFVSPWYRTFTVEKTDRLGELLRQCYFYPYERLSDEVKAELRAGVLFTFDLFTVGVLLEDIVRYENSKTSFSWEQLKNGLSYSFAYNPSLYSKRGRLVKFLYSFALELEHMLDKENGVLMGGSEFCWQFARKHSYSLRVGYNTPYSKIPSGDLTIGLGYRFRDYDIGLDAVIPSETLANTGSGTFTLGLTFSALF